MVVIKLQLIQLFYKFHFLLRQIRTAIISVLIIIFIVLTAYYSVVFKKILTTCLVKYGALDEIQSLFLALGSALVGATAIAFSLIMFAMQVNIERMPYALFKKTSSDIRLLGAFLGTFSIAVGIASFSVITKQALAVYAIAGAAWGLFFIVLLFLYAYQRALFLINPLAQLNILLNDAKEELLAWSRRATRAEPLLKNQLKKHSDITKNTINAANIERTRYFMSNPHWINNSTEAIHHAFSYAKRYAECGDYEVSMTALSVVAMIHTTYIQAKGATFYSHNLLMNNPFATDNFW